MRLTLAWHGPLRAGSLPAEPDSLAALDIPAVYIRAKRYENGRVLAYVGQSRHLIARIDQHIAQLLALQSAVRDATGNTRFAGSALERFAGLNRLDDTIALVRDDLRRLIFFYAPCDAPEMLGLLEHLLKRRIEERALASTALGCDNRNAVPFAPIEEGVTAENAFDALGSEDRAFVAMLIGTEDLVAALEPADGA